MSTPEDKQRFSGPLGSVASIPYKLLRDAIQAVPSLKFALGIVGLVSVIAITKGIGIDPRLGAVGAVVMIFLMTLLVIFAKLTAIANKHFLAPVLVLMWGALTLTLSSAGLFFTSVFFKWPADMRFLLPEQQSTGPAWQAAETGDVAVQLVQAQSWKLPPGNSFRSLDVELRLTNSSQLPIPIDPKASFVFAGKDGTVREEIPMNLTSGQGELGAVLKPSEPKTVYLEGKLFPNHARQLDTGLAAYVQVFYDHSLSKKDAYYISDFFNFDRKTISWQGGE